VEDRRQRPVVELLRRGYSRYTSVPAPGTAGPLSHGLAMIGLPVLLGFLGSLLDARLGTRPVFLIALAAFGVAGSFASAFYRYEARVARQEAGKPWTRRTRDRVVAR
jgi:hypothetical protein